MHTTMQVCDGWGSMFLESGTKRAKSGLSCLNQDGWHMITGTTCWVYNYMLFQIKHTLPADGLLCSYGKKALDYWEKDAATNWNSFSLWSMKCEIYCYMLGRKWSSTWKTSHSTWQSSCFRTELCHYTEPRIAAVYKLVTCLWCGSRMELASCNEVRCCYRECGILNNSTFCDNFTSAEMWLFMHVKILF